MRLWLEEEKSTYTASEDFKRNIEDGFRYVDKTELLIPLLRREHETTFFLRPRRFGKTLTLSMIRYFVEDTRDEALNAENRELFQGLKIMEAEEKGLRQMTSFPVINLTMQTVYADHFKDAMGMLVSTIESAYSEKNYLLKEKLLEPEDKKYFQRILYRMDEDGREVSREDYLKSLKRLSEMLRKTSGKRVVVLIDEYDVPLEKAYQHHYYREMVNVIGPLLQSVLKTNSENLQFAVVTGCLRIAKEGIYTGLNNPAVNTVLSNQGSDAIGFTEEETRKLLNDSGVGEYFDQIREWYDGYRFGKTVIYNPWSVIKRIEDLNADRTSPPLTYWANTSSNAIIRELAEQADESTKEKIERAMQGENITFGLRDNIVYDELYDEPDNVLNVMLNAGYLTATGFDGKTITAVIPNKEVHRIFEDQISSWFKASLKTFDVRTLYDAFETGDTARAEKILNDEFLASMSYFDSREAFYHGVLLALMQLNKEFRCKSNRESGKGRFDIMAKRIASWDLAFILEVKVSEKETNMLSDAKKAAEQIAQKAYLSDLQQEEYQQVITYGIAFCEKRCRIIQGPRYQMKG